MSKRSRGPYQPSETEKVEWELHLLAGTKPTLDAHGSKVAFLAYAWNLGVDIALTFFPGELAALYGADWSSDGWVWCGPFEYRVTKGRFETRATVSRR